MQRGRGQPDHLIRRRPPDLARRQHFQQPVVLRDQPQRHRNRIARRVVPRRHQQTKEVLEILPGDPPIEVRLRRSARAQRFSLRVSRTDGRVSLSLPVWAAETEALKFLSERESWVRHHFEAAPPVRMPAIGATLPVMGTERPIIAGPGRVARFDGTSISVPDDDNIGPRIRAMLQAMAREHLTRAAALAATALGKPYGRITLRDGDVIVVPQRRLFE